VTGGGDLARERIPDVVDADSVLAETRSRATPADRFDQIYADREIRNCTIIVHIFGLRSWIGGFAPAPVDTRFVGAFWFTAFADLGRFVGRDGSS
jgi:hypothetical protein